MIDTTVLMLMSTAWLGLVAAAISPGPNMFACVQRGLASGYMAGVRVAFGIALASILWVVVIFLGLVSLLKLHPNIAPIMSILGGGYLLYLGIKGFRSMLKKQSLKIEEIPSINPWHDILHGFLVSISNPKVALFWASLSSIIGTKLESTSVLVTFALGCAMVTFTIYSAYGIVFSMPKIRAAYFIHYKIGDGIFGTVFTVLGLGLVFYGITSLYPIN